MVPFIKKFSHDGFFYIYDVNTNQIIEVEEAIFNIIDQYDVDNPGRLESKFNGTYSISDLRKNIEKIENAGKEYGLFSDFRPKTVALGIREADDVKNLYAKGLRQILLELTRGCNLNCSYCDTSGKYSNNGSMQYEMSKETCREAVDFFFQNTHRSEQTFISFYGGEPTLKIEMIRETVEYVKKNFFGKKVSFNLTTNGTLLNREMLDFFIENDFNIMISIDGPQAITDRYRIDRTGKGTFHVIMQNLAFLREYNMDYYSRKVSISSVLAPPFDSIDDILDFFANDKTLTEIRANGRIRASYVNTKETSFIEDFHLDGSMAESKQISYKFIERLKKSILSHDLSKLTIEKKSLFSLLNNLTKRSIKQLYEEIPPMGSCHIGMRRLFVRTDGDFYICEKGGRDYKLGNIDTGFDYERIAGYYRKLEEVLEDCRNCWALIHCERCWVQLGDLNQFTGKKKEEFCSSSKDTIETGFKLYTELLRTDPDSLKIFEGITIV